MGGGALGGGASGGGATDGSATGGDETGGAIDGSHTRIPPPHRDEKSYYNRKHFHPVILQAVVDPYTCPYVHLIFLHCIAYTHARRHTDTQTYT